MSVLSRIRARLARFGREEDGANLVEFALVVLLFLILTFAIIDFGRMANAWVGANKATQIGARIAAVRPPACAGTMPATNARGALTTPTFGTLCRAGAGTCANPGELTCVGDAANEVFTTVRPLLPPGTAIGNLRFRYTFDPNLGFLGGPYVPMVTVELENACFGFITLVGTVLSPSVRCQVPVPGAVTDIRIPSMSVSLPAEDLAMGTGG